MTFLKRVLIALLLLTVNFAGFSASAQSYQAHDNETDNTWVYGEDETSVNNSNIYAQQDSSRKQNTEVNQNTKRIETEKKSPLEALYSERSGKNLSLFGYDMFGIPSDQTQQSLDQLSATMPAGDVQDHFILSAGDTLEIVFAGQRADRAVYKINSQGTLIIPNLPPIPAAGRTIGQVRLSIQAAAKNLHNTQAYISLSTVRQINILLIGHVKKPGRQTLTVFHTALDALMSAGGIDKTGSVRNIRIIRGGRTHIIDIYDLLIYGGAHSDISLRDGDRIIVPPIGQTVAIAGEVNRPGIYEIDAPAQSPLGLSGKEQRPRYSDLTLNEMLDLSGGVLLNAKNRFIKMHADYDGQENISNVETANTPAFAGGSILLVSRVKEKKQSMIKLDGHTRDNGLHTLDKNKSLSALLSDQHILGEDIYPLIGIIKRWDPELLAHRLIDFPLRLVLKKDYDRTLKESDTVILFSNEQIKNLDNIQEEITPQQAGFQNVSYTLDDDGYAPKSSENRWIEDQTLIAFLKERTAFIRGAIRAPGAYPVSKGTTLDTILAVAGGLALEANTSNIEITSALQGRGHMANRETGTRRLSINLTETRAEDIMIEPGDSVRVNQKFKKIEDKSVQIIGEVVNPGRYDLIPGDTLLALITRAGGYTDQGYAEGAIFSRASERRAEEARYRAQAKEIKQSVAVALETEEKAVNAGKIAEARALAAELEDAKALGRITVEASPEVLSVHPEQNILLEAGDRIYIPKRGLTVRVSGEILSPATLQFREEKPPREYIREAGGFTYHADKDRAFVLYPDGSAQPLKVSAWNHKATFIPPGSTIIVPRDPKPYDFIESAKDISQILTNLAISAIFIDDVRDEND